MLLRVCAGVGEGHGEWVQRAAWPALGYKTGWGLYLEEVVPYVFVRGNGGRGGRSNGCSERHGPHGGMSKRRWCRACVYEGEGRAGEQ